MHLKISMDFVYRKASKRKMRWSQKSMMHIIRSAYIAGSLMRMVVSFLKDNPKQYELPYKRYR